MARMHRVEGIEGLPIYMVSADQPQTVSEDDFIDSVPLHELIARLKTGEHLYLVNYASNPGHTRLTCVV